MLPLWSQQQPPFSTRAPCTCDSQSQGGSLPVPTMPAQSSTLGSAFLKRLLLTLLVSTQLLCTPGQMESPADKLTAPGCSLSLLPWPQPLPGCPWLLVAGWAQGAQCHPHLDPAHCRRAWPAQGWDHCHTAEAAQGLWSPALISLVNKCLESTQRRPRTGLCTKPVVIIHRATHTLSCARLHHHELLQESFPQDFQSTGLK